MSEKGFTDFDPWREIYGTFYHGENKIKNNKKHCRIQYTTTNIDCLSLAGTTEEKKRLVKFTVSCLRPDINKYSIPFIFQKHKSCFRSQITRVSTVFGKPVRCSADKLEINFLTDQELYEIHGRKTIKRNFAVTL